MVPFVAYDGFVHEGSPSDWHSISVDPSFCPGSPRKGIWQKATLNGAAAIAGRQLQLDHGKLVESGVRSPESREEAHHVSVRET